jgi:large subunit ribosomal protein L15
MLRGKGRLKATSLTVSVTLKDLENMTADTISLDTLKLEKVIPQRAANAKVIATGTLAKKVIITGLPVSQKARELIEKVGGAVEK